MRKIGAKQKVKINNISRKSEQKKKRNFFSIFSHISLFKLRLCKPSETRNKFLFIFKMETIKFLT